MGRNAIRKPPAWQFNASSLRLGLLTNLQYHNLPLIKFPGEQYMTPWRLLYIVCLCWLSTQPLQAATVSVPLRFEYGFIHQALLAWTYDDSGKLAALQDSSGCNRVILSDPKLTPENKKLHLNQQAEVEVGTTLNGRCAPFIHWRGRLHTWHRPEIADSGSVVRFPIAASRLYDETGMEIPAGPLLNQARRFAEPRLNDFSIDLKPALKEIETLLPQVLPRNSPQLASILDSLAVTDLAVNNDNLQLTLRFTTPDLPGGEPSSEPPLTAKELEQWENTWEQWDAFLTAAIKQAASDTDSPALRHALESVLLNARYVWRDALAAETPEERPDPVRLFFLETWDQLAPVLATLTARLPAEEGIRYAAFINAMDTLEALDALGPALGLEISSAGLRRLARLLIRDGDTPLQYRNEIDPELRRLFGLTPIDTEMQGLGFPLDWLIDPAFAARSDTALAARLNGWAPDRRDAGRYLPLAHQLLSQATEDSAQSQALRGDLRPLFRNLVLAAAWQESCWRQFIQQGGSIQPLVSPSGDVGILQINTRVWRGLYHSRRLRDDIAYNARAGSEILLHYLTDYALAKKEDRLGGSRDALARSTYAMYNGGPRHISRYRKSGTSPHLRRIDRAFWDKYRQIQRDGFHAVAGCYGGSVRIDPATTPASSTDATATAKPIDSASGSVWIKRQNPQHYTLQLIAVQEESAAQSFLKRLGNRLGTYYRFRRDGKTWYAVVLGVYPNRKEAEQAAAVWRSKLSLPDIWIRDFAGLQQQIGRS